MRLALGWTMIVAGSLGVTAMFWVYVSWLWYELTSPTEPLWSWLVSQYR